MQSAGATLQKTLYNTKTRQITGDYRVLKHGENQQSLRHISGRQILDNHQASFFTWALKEDIKTKNRSTLYLL